MSLSPTCIPHIRIHWTPCLRSGGRSAILPTTHTCFRLKGCGNYLDAEGYRHPFPGFPLEKLEAKDGVEIRGCCFKHTAVREQYMSDLVGEVLGGEGISVGNKPIAMWQYHIPTQPLPKVCTCMDTKIDTPHSVHHFY